MNACQRIREATLDALTEDRAEPAEVERHLLECAECRAELASVQALWQRLGELPTPRPRPGTQDRIAEALASAAHNATRERSTMKISWLAAALLAGVLLGGAAGLTIKPKAEVVADAASGPTYLLLLHESTREHQDITPAQLDSIVGEYRNWARRLQNEQKLVGAEKLRDEASRWLDPAGTLTMSEPDEHVSGYFVIRAQNYDDAVAIARGSPHLKYGGTIEVRAIQNTSEQ
jgi:hypothetical protein